MTDIHGLCLAQFKSCICSWSNYFVEGSAAVLLAGFGALGCLWSQRDGGPKKGEEQLIFKKVGVRMVSAEANIFWQDRTIGAHDIGLGRIWLSFENCLLRGWDIREEPKQLQGPIFSQLTFQGPQKHFIRPRCCSHQSRSQSPHSFCAKIEIKSHREIIFWWGFKYYKNKVCFHVCVCNEGLGPEPVLGLSVRDSGFLWEEAEDSENWAYLTSQAKKFHWHRA